MPIPATPVNQEPPERHTFVNRTQEAKWLYESIKAHHDHVVEDRINGRHFRNVLTYIGPAGVGKSALLNQLSRWLRDSSHIDLWGTPPQIGRPIYVGTWAVDSATGNLEVYEALLELRRTLGDAKREWPAFDLAFTALAPSLSRPENVPLSRQRNGQPAVTLNDVVAAAVGEAAGIILPGGGLATPAVAAINGAIARRQLSARTKRLFAEWSEYKLEEIVRTCISATASEAQTAALASRVAYLASVDIMKQTATERPLVVIFVDDFQELQAGRGNGETLLHGLITSLPYVLFVVAGRNRINWHKMHQTHLRPVGPDVWPGLAANERAREEPRQHSVGMLSDEDSIVMLTARLRSTGRQVERNAVARLAREAEGNPIHLDAIVSLAEGSHVRNLSYEDLKGPFPVIVNAILRDMDLEAQKLFLTACILPHFDAQLLAYGAGTSVGAGMRFVSRSIVLHDPSSPYPYRIQSSIREVVRRTGHLAEGGWDASDWRVGALRLVDAAANRFENAMEEEDDRLALQALSLAINVCAEHGVFQGWIVAALRRSPDLMGLSTMVSIQPMHNGDPEAIALVEYVRSLGMTVSREKVAALQRIAETPTLIASSAGLWAGYTLRSLGDWDAATSQFEWLIECFDDRPTVYKYQLVNTQLMARRFKDALANLHGLDPDQQSRVHATVHWRHGRFEGVVEMLTARISSPKTSRRFAAELYGTRARAKHHSSTIDSIEIDEVATIATSTGHLGTLAVTIGLAIQRTSALGDIRAVREAVSDIEALDIARWKIGPIATECLALCAWINDDEGLLNQAHAYALKAGATRSSEWIGPEMLLRHLGRHLASADGTQWLESYETVQSRWLRVYRDIIHRATGIQFLN